MTKEGYEMMALVRESDVIDKTDNSELASAFKYLWDKYVEQGPVLDKIRKEIEALPKTYPFVNHIDMYVKEDDVKKIIDKYKAESEGMKQ